MQKYFTGVQIKAGSRQGALHPFITFFDWQYSQAERKKADVVVYAVEGQAITGHSRVVNSDDKG
jgi:hypothetical protein